MCSLGARCPIHLRYTYINSQHFPKGVGIIYRTPLAKIPTYSSCLVHIHTSDHTRTPIVSTMNLAFLQNLTNKVMYVLLAQHSHSHLLLLQVYLGSLTMFMLLQYFYKLLYNALLGLQLHLFYFFYISKEAVCRN